MATVTKWTPFGVALNITATGGTVTRISATQFTVKISASWETYYSGALTKYGMVASSGGSSVTLKSFSNTAADSGSGSFTGTYSISGNGSATKTITVTFRNFNDDNGDSATKSVSFNVTVPAWTSYTIKYNANGGSGAPGNQTKWRDQTLKLSTVKPTRSGYSFLGWSTSATATSATYSAGANYTANAATTLYAVWKANTYVVKYNANGGTGAPGNQTKTYGVTLKLSATKPTRAKHNFLGWSTSASATAATYAAGANYTANAATTLYAVWEVAYVAPRITNLSINRCYSDGSTLSDEGTYAFVSCNWTTDETVSSITIKWKTPSATTWSSETIAASGTSGSINKVCCGGTLSTDSTYVVSITVADASGSTTQQRTLSSAFFTIDYRSGGKGVAVGKSAELDNVFDVGFQLKLSGGIMPIEISEGTDLDAITTPGIYRCLMSATAATLVNSPTNIAFTMEVLPNHNTTQRIIEYRANDVPRSFMRNQYNGSWGVWWEYVPRQNKISTPVNLLTLSSDETYTFQYDGYLVAKASYRSGYYVNCTLYGSNGVGIDVSVTSGTTINMQGNPSNIMFVRKGMYVGKVSTNSTSYNILEFNAVY